MMADQHWWRSPPSGAPMFEKKENATKVPSWVPLWWIQHDKVPSIVAQCATKRGSVSFQWGKCDAGPHRLPYILEN